jgi:2-polyprenyl-3-methyl-5-hydroxy-6-metoxy-1,4-benzoquinol methylase
MQTQPVVDQTKVDQFVGRVLGDTSATLVTLLAAIGDRLGLFKDLDASGPVNSAEFAARTGINERYAREWLGGMATAGYLAYDAATQRFNLPREHAPALAQEGGPYFFGGVHEMLPAMIGVLDQVTESFRRGGGVPQSAYDVHFWNGMERFTMGWFENLLTQQWIPALPDVQAKLETGARVADIGCGRGRALIKMAQAFPKARYVGYDVFQPSIDRANANATAAGVAERVSFQRLDAATGLPERYDVITTFDVVHDAVDPRGLLRSIRGALNPDGIYVCLDVNCSENLEQNAGPLGAMFHGFSVLYCMTTSLANGGAGLGTVGLHEPKLRELCAQAGFSSVRRVPLENPFNNLYEVRP